MPGLQPWCRSAWLRRGGACYRPGCVLRCRLPVRGRAADPAIPDPADATLAAYQSRAQEYLRGSAGPAAELIAYLGRFASLTRPGPVLEIGSGPGWDAGYLEGHGVRVIRTDATPAFVSLLRAAGHNARPLDARTDPLGGPYQGI